LSLTETLPVSFAEAYDSLDPDGNITIKWDVMQWTPDGYVVSTITTSSPFNFNLLVIGC
jgi:hypothetical protein